MVVGEVKVNIYLECFDLLQGTRNTQLVSSARGCLLQGGRLIDGCAHKVFLERSVTLFRLKVIPKSLLFAKTVVQQSSVP